MPGRTRVVDKGAWAMEQNIHSGDGDGRLLILRRDLLTSQITFLACACYTRHEFNPPAWTQMLDDHSGSESPAQIDVLQQLSFVLLQSRDIQQGAWWRNKLTTDEIAWRLET